MELNKQVTSLEISKRLKELGVKQESLFVWTRMRQTDEFRVNTLSEAGEWRYYDFTNTVSAFTVAELGEMLPDEYPGDSESDLVIYKAQTRLSTTWFVRYENDTQEVVNHTEFSNTEADARGKMLIYLLENKLVTL